MPTTQMRAAGALAALAMTTLATGCEIVRERGTDTVALVDTVVQVDTLVRYDTVRAAGAPPLPAAPISAAPIPAAPPPAPPPGPAAPATGGQAVTLPAPTLAVTEADVAYLRGRALVIPVAGAKAAALPNTFDEARAGGARRHDAIDILAPRGTPVLSADAGRVARIETTAGGGLSVYATDPSGRFVYYYAHLDAYRPGLRDGQPLARGEAIGFVGTTGNAPPGTPHLHFAISLLGEPSRWWDGTAINPFPLLTAAP
jgi:murein DD-endopeptidase MepM/ murein hydrolase activator NlpD